jgi:hypothetical protein
MSEVPAMDIARPEVRRQKRIRRPSYAGAAFLLAVVAIAARFLAPGEVSR